MTLKEYIGGNPLRYEKSPMTQYDETIFQLYECLDAIGFAGRMGYKDRALLKAWLAQIGLPMKLALVQHMSSLDILNTHQTIQPRKYYDSIQSILYSH